MISLITNAVAFAVLILILLEVTQMIEKEIKNRSLKICLNPYSTGSNSNVMVRNNGSIVRFVLILILLEVTQILKTNAGHFAFNPS